MSTTAAMDKAVSLGEADAGYDESMCDASTGNNTKYGKWYGMNCAAWCAMAVSKWYYDAGQPQPASTSKGFSYTPSGASWYQSKNAWSGPSANPERGWVVFFYSASAGRISHVGLVRGPKSGGMVPTVEGNTNGAGSAEGGSVLLKNRDPSQSLSFRIAGYGRPDILEPEKEWWEMPIGADEIKQIKDACYSALNDWDSMRPPPLNATAKPQTVTEAVHGVWGGGIPALMANQNLFKAWLVDNNIPTAQEIADAVVAALPSGGDLDMAAIEQAFRNVLDELVIDIQVGTGADPAAYDAETSEERERLRRERGLAEEDERRR